MIDNFFRLHEKNRKLNFDELFQKVGQPQTTLVCILWCLTSPLFI